MRQKKVIARSLKYSIWAVEIVCLDGYGKIDRWELWNTHNTKAEALCFIKESTDPTSKKNKNKSKVLLSKRFYRVRKFVPEASSD